MGLRRLLQVAAAAAFVLVLLGGGTASSSGPAPVSTWVVDGGSVSSVETIAVRGSTAYIGGSFGYVGPSTGSFVSADPATGAVALPRAIVDGRVDAAAPDGSGGFFIGGAFRTVPGGPEQTVAHVMADGTIDADWGKSIVLGGIVHAIAVSDTTVYVGGELDNGSVVALAKTTGEPVEDFAPPSIGFVFALALSGSTLYAGGNLIDGVDQRTLAAVDAGSGEPTSWPASTDGVVYSLAASADTLYAGGAFSTANGTAPRHGAAAFDRATGAVTAWDPEPDGEVDAVALVGSTVYLGGIFSMVGDAPRDGLAAVSGVDGTASAWHPDPDPGGFRDVSAITVSGSTVFTGGSSLAGYDAMSGHATGFAPTAGDFVRALAISGGRLGVGGDFTTIGADTGPVPRPLPRPNLAAIDLTTGRPTTWAPTVSGDVRTLALSGSTLYAGGDFFDVNGAQRSRLAAFDLGTGTLKPWNPPGYNGTVTALAISGSTVYVGGQLTNIGFPNPQFRVEGVDAVSGATTWQGAADGGIYALDVAGQTLYVGGAFTTLGGVARNHLAALPSSGPAVPTSWNPDVDDWVMALAHSGSAEYAGGFFGSVNGGTPRAGAAAFDMGSGAATAWDPQLTGIPRRPRPPCSGSLRARRPCTSPATSRVRGAAPTDSLAAVSPSTGALVGAWAPPVDDAGTVALSPQGLVFGGRFGVVHAPPDAPTDVTATGGEESASVSFTPPAYDGGDAVDSYTVTSSGGQTATGAGSPIVVPGLTGGTTYSFTVTASNDAGAGPASEQSNTAFPAGPDREQPPPPPDPVSERPAVPEPPPAGTRVPPPHHG